MASRWHKDLSGGRSAPASSGTTAPPTTAPAGGVYGANSIFSTLPLDPTRVVPDLTDEALAWIRALHASIWKSRTTTERTNRLYSREVTRWEVVREMTPVEWTKLCGIVREFHLPCTMENTNFGFGIGITIYQHGVAPDDSPEVLLSLTQDQLPGGKADNIKSSPQKRWDTAWAEFSSLTHSTRNRELLAFYKLEAPRGESHYVY